MKADQMTAIFSQPVNVRTLSKKGTRCEYEAPVDICARIAKAYDLLAVERFSAFAEVVPWKKNGVKVTGKVEAVLIQPCAFSMEPMDAVVDEDVDILMVPEGSKLARPKLDGEGEIIVDPDGPDLPDTFTGDSIDLAEIWLEFFALGLDPFATKEGAELPESVMGGIDEDKEDSPFAALAALKKH